MRSHRPLIILSRVVQGGRPGLRRPFPAGPGRMLSERRQVILNLSSSCVVERAVHSPGPGPGLRAPSGPAFRCSIPLRCAKNFSRWVAVPWDLGCLPAKAGTWRMGVQSWRPPRGEVPRGDAHVLTPLSFWVPKPGPVSAGHPLIGLGALRNSGTSYALLSALPAGLWEGQLLSAVGPEKRPRASARSGNYFFLGEAAGHWVRKAILRQGECR